MESRQREARSDACELDRRAQKCFFQAPAVFAIVVLGSVGRTPQKRAIRNTLVHELGCDDSPCAGRFAVDAAHFVDDAEAIASAQIVQEIDVARKNVRQLHGDRVGQRDRVRCAEQRTTDLVRAELEAYRDIGRLRSADETVADSIDREQRAALREVAQAEHASTGIGPDPKWFAGAQLVERPGAGVGTQKILCGRILDADSRQHASHRVAATHPFFLPVGLVRDRRRNRWQRELPRDPFARDGIERRIRHKPECGDDAECHECSGGADAAGADGIEQRDDPLS